MTHTKKRLDKHLVDTKRVATRSQAESYIRLGKVKVNGSIITKPGYDITHSDKVTIGVDTQYVSRAGLKLESVASKLNLVFAGKTVLDVGSSSGGFTDYALRNGAKKVIAVDVGTDQMNPKLRRDKRVELHEKTDIREFVKSPKAVDIDIVLIDVSFISILEVLNVLPLAISKTTDVVAMVKPQFETNESSKKNKGIVKNESIRRQILTEFEEKIKKTYLLKGKADSAIRGEKGNQERFYMLALLKG